MLAALTGIGFVAYLVYAELFLINAICRWCTSVHALTLLLFALTALGTAAGLRTNQQGKRPASGARLDMDGCASVRAGYTPQQVAPSRGLLYVDAAGHRELRYPGADPAWPRTAEAR